MGFGSLLVLPERGGIRRSLTSQLLKQLDGQSRGSQSITHFTRVGHKSSKRQPTSVDEMAAKRASSKLQDGDVRGAARCLTPSETVSPLTHDTLTALESKHPPRPVDRRLPPPLSSNSLVISGEDIRVAIRGFAPGSSGGRDGLRPQHFKDLTSSPGNTLIDALVDFSNLVLGGGVPISVRPSFFGANLIPFTKKDGGSDPSRSVSLCVVWCRKLPPNRQFPFVLRFSPHYSSVSGLVEKLRLWCTQRGDILISRPLIGHS